MNWAAMRTAYATIVRKEVTRFMRIWQQTLLPPVMTTSLYFVIFGNLIGPRIGAMEGHRYIDFIVPGLILMAVITNAYANVSSSFFSAKFQRSIEELQVSPTPNSIIALLFSLGGFLNGVFARTFDDISIVPNFILTPLTYLGGIFYSIKLLPEFWQGVSHINPILYMINAFRYGFLGITDIHLGVSYTLILLFTAGLFALNLKLLNDGYGIRE